MALQGRRILLGVTGGIAAYKAAELVRGLTLWGAEVRVVMTAAACHFLTPLTLEALSGHPVAIDLMDRQRESAMSHIALARWAERVLIAPASADFMARLAAGFANDLLSTLCLACEAPILLAPAMNRAMWHNLATRANAALLESRGIALWGPAAGALACGEEGEGRMLEPQRLVEHLAASFLDPAPALMGLSALVTAGPTREALDPVRFLSNRSSGRMGYAMAAALKAQGARVCLVSGPTALAPPPGVERIDVEDALSMHRAVFERIGECALFVACAAVADYRPAEVAPEKLKKGENTRVLHLIKNPDILAEVAALPPGIRPFCVGFAAETHDLEQHARDKLYRKRLDIIAANRVGGPDGGFDRVSNRLSVYWPGGQAEWPLLPKSELAHRLVCLIVERYHASHSS
ncbi:MAG: bifunctional phosphopantothenoylcysteine decarboxylase/phosphopantothenate--cysteine ligase CoaBC [Pseudomonadota bacterium]